MPAKVKGRFIDPMLLLRTDSLPNDGDRWEYQLKFDGYRAIAFKTDGKLHLRSRNDKDFSLRSTLFHGVERCRFSLGTTEKIQASHALCGGQVGDLTKGRQPRGAYVSKQRRYCRR